MSVLHVLRAVFVVKLPTNLLYVLKVTTLKAVQGYALYVLLGIIV